MDYDEIWKESYSDPKLWPAGAFDYELTLYDHITKEQEFDIGEWLSNNCKENFILARDQSQIIAGGFADNIKAWKNRRKSKMYNPKTTEYRIRLYATDIMFFRMVWLTD